MVEKSDLRSRKQQQSESEPQARPVSLKSSITIRKLTKEEKLKQAAKKNQAEEAQVDSANEPNDSVQVIDERESLRNDLGNILLLLFLYFLQGIPLGLAGGLPLMLSSHKISYADRGTFSFAFWPFSCKLLWAPIVDSIYFKRFGRRKTWLIPTQYLIGIFMLAFSTYVQDLIDGNLTQENGIYQLTFIFFMLTFLSATQDIAVDGWALTMLSKENISWASTCNSVGQTAGWFVGNVLFLAFESKDFSNQYVRPFFGLDSQTGGLINIDMFMKVFGIVFIVSTTFVLFFKRENDTSSNDDKNKSTSIEDNLSIKDTYILMWKVLKLEPVIKLNLILLTAKIGFALESLTVIKLIEAGVPKANLSLLAVPLTPMQIILPFLISKYTNGPRPLDFFVKSLPCRLAVNIVAVIWVFYAPSFEQSAGVFPIYFYVICFIISLVSSVFMLSMFVAQMSFFAQISDKAIGGTYMTFLNTITNFGGNWPNTAVLFIAGYITMKDCFVPNLNSYININGTCTADHHIKHCESKGGKCVTVIDPFYVLTGACTVFGFIWMFMVKKLIYRLQSMPKAAWKIKLKST